MARTRNRPLEGESTGSTSSRGPTKRRNNAAIQPPAVNVKQEVDELEPQVALAIPPPKKKRKVAKAPALPPEEEDDELDWESEEDMLPPRRREELTQIQQREEEAMIELQETVEPSLEPMKEKRSRRRAMGATPGDPGPSGLREASGPPPQARKKKTVKKPKTPSYPWLPPIRVPTESPTRRKRARSPSGSLSHSPSPASFSPSPFEDEEGEEVTPRSRATPRQLVPSPPPALQPQQTIFRLQDPSSFSSAQFMFAGPYKDASALRAATDAAIAMVDMQASRPNTTMLKPGYINGARIPIDPGLIAAHEETARELESRLAHESEMQRIFDERTKQKASMAQAALTTNAYGSKVVGDGRHIFLSSAHMPDDTFRRNENARLASVQEQATGEDGEGSPEIHPPVPVYTPSNPRVRSSPRRGQSRRTRPYIPEDYEPEVNEAAFEPVMYPPSEDDNEEPAPDRPQLLACMNATLSPNLSLKGLVRTAQRPPYSLPWLVRCCILGSELKAKTLNEIYADIEAHYPFFEGQIAWKGSIRHMLSLSACYVKVPRPITQPGKGCYWTVDLNAREGDKKRPRKRNRNKLRKSDDADDHIEVDALEASVEAPVPSRLNEVPFNERWVERSPSGFTPEEQANPGMKQPPIPPDVVERSIRKFKFLPEGAMRHYRPHTFMQRSAGPTRTRGSVRGAARGGAPRGGFDAGPSARAQAVPNGTAVPTVQAPINVETAPRAGAAPNDPASSNITEAMNNVELEEEQEPDIGLVEEQEPTQALVEDEEPDQMLVEDQEPHPPPAEDENPDVLPPEDEESDNPPVEIGEPAQLSVADGPSASLLIKDNKPPLPIKVEGDEEEGDQLMSEDE